MRSVFDGVLSKVTVRPVAASGATNGTGVDTQGYQSAMAVVENGAATGSPSSYTVDAKVQESSDNSSWSDVSGATITQITADSKSAQIRIPGLGTSRLRYLRLVITPALTGGSTPKALISGHILLANPYNAPVGNSSTPA